MRSHARAALGLPPIPLLAFDGAVAGQVHGETHPVAKLDEDVVRYCRALVRDGWSTCAGLARIFGVAQSAMWMAVHGATWNHVPGAVAYSGPWRGGSGPSRQQIRRWCPTCTAPFVAGRVDKVFCSAPCRMVAFRRRRCFRRARGER